VTEIELRHLLHMNPEPAYREYKTKEILKSAISELGIYKLVEVSETGLIAEKSVTKEEPFLILRAEMDALPLEEETGWEFASKNGYMHACGHDFHMSAVFGAMVRTKDLRKNILFVFQPAEESGGGAKEIVDYIKNNYKVKAAVGFHVTDEYDFGVVASRVGVLFASAVEFDVIIEGEAAHIALAAKGKNALRAAVSFLDAVYRMEIPAETLLGIGKITGGVARNIVPPLVKLEGTIRSPSVDFSMRLLEQMSCILERLKTSTGVDYQVIKGGIYPEVVVDGGLLETLKKACERTGLKFVECEMKKTAEDFGYFSLRFPTLSFWFGVGDERERVGLHNPKFLPKDEYIPRAADLLSELVKML